ncbi:MAG: GTPase ObgE [Dehalococcoidia bacterium]|nr:GTPase ObgE [Dehalococcoidia bacterium]
MIDQVDLHLKAGEGGAGVVSFRREKFVPRGGPDGGDGGRGGSIYLVASEDASTLSTYRYKHHYRAGRGGNGSGKNQHGRKGDDVELVVPVGTLVQTVGDDGALAVIDDLTTPGQRILVARGGRGGWGNQHFKGPTNQAPKVAQSGQLGEEVHLRLDLKLIADIGVIGRPNAGKSSFVTAVTAARPRVADYAFTTLEPILGVVERGYESFVVAEIPGLIEGAAGGAGLGHEFLRHAERSRAFLHLIDGGRPDPLLDYTQVNAELTAYDPDLSARPQLVAINKIDMPEVLARKDELQAAFAAHGVELRFISAAGGGGVDSLLDELMAIVKQAPTEEVEERGVPVLRPRPAGRRFRVQRSDGAFSVHGASVEALAGMMDVRHDETREEFMRQLQRMGVAAALEKAGVQPGDAVRIGSVQLAWKL